MPQTDDVDLVLRPAVEDDHAQVAEVYLAARRTAPMPAPVHTEAAIRLWLGGRLQADPVWVAERGPAIVGFARLTDGWLDDLYVHPDHQGQGVGSALLDVAKAQRPQGFCLWVFESNTPARAFYERQGLVALERTDGSANEERAPDLRMAYPGRDPLAFFRGLIDQVDVELGDLLARRAALTRVVQQHKRATHAGPADPGRDAAREREIVTSMAARAPELGEDRLARIVHSIISESLDAAR